MTLSRSERLSLAGMLAIFTWFTWRALTMHYSGDDVTNMYSAWELNPWRLGKAVFLFWVPIYRPVGGVVYRAFYEFVGFHPEPLKAFCWLLLAANVVFAYRFFRTLLAVPSAAFTALGLTLVHPLFQDLYLNSGTLYDQFWFLFTTLGLTLYAQWRNSEKGLTLPRQALLTLLSILAMSSKESGVSLPVLMGFFELIFHFRRQQPLAPWLRTRGPLFAVLAAITLVDIRRVNLTPVIAMTAEYHAKASLSLWLEHVAGYFTILSAGHLAFTAFAVSFLLLAMAAVGLALKNRPMLFGLAFFVVTITPVALISSRLGYVLYVPELGLGLWLGAAFLEITRALPRARPACASVVILLATAFFAGNWPAPLDPTRTPEFRLTEQFRHEYPKLRRKAKLLFVADDFPVPAWDLLFNLRLLYRDHELVIHRLSASPDQGPQTPNDLTGYDYVFTLVGDRYLELDRTDVRRSIRDKIFSDYPVGRLMSISRRDHVAYVLSGLTDGDTSNPSRWTDPSSRYRFDLYPAPADFHAKFWVPDFVAKTGVRTLEVLVNGHQVGLLPLTQEGMHEIRLPVPASAISPSGFTVLDLNVQNPWKDPSGKAFGIIIQNAGFDYATIKE